MIRRFAVSRLNLIILQYHEDKKVNFDEFIFVISKYSYLDETPFSIWMCSYCLVKNFILKNTIGQKIE